MKILVRLLALFLIVPVVELALLVQVDKLIGFWPTIGLIVFTGVLGSWMARREGLSVWRRLQERMAAGSLPGRELLDGVIILVAGALLITPGVLTDVLGFLCLIPATRAVIRRIALQRLQRGVERGHISVVGFGGWPGTAYREDQRGGPEEPQWRGTATDLPRHTQELGYPDGE